MEPQDEKIVEPEVSGEVPSAGAVATPEAGPVVATQNIESEPIAEAQAAAPEAAVAVAASKQPSRAKTIGLSLLGAVATLVIFVITQIVGLLVSSTYLFIIMGYTTISVDTFNEVIAKNDGFVSLVCQAAEFIALAIFWLIVRRRSVTRAKAAHVSYKRGAAAVVQRILIILLLGVVLQFCISGVLTFLVYAFPAISQAYESLAEVLNDSLGDTLGQISAAFGAPLVEELLVRGLFFEFMLRIFQSDFAVWRTKSYPQRGSKPQLAPTTTTAAFWIANILQALCFGIIHLNLIQGSYAFVMGLILGWVYWRTGKLRYSMLLHFAINGSSLFIDVVLATLGITSEIAMSIVGLVTLVLTVLILRLFAKKTRSRQ